MNLQYPNITGKDSREQLEQIRSYLFQLVQQLNIESGGTAANSPRTLQDAGKYGGSSATVQEGSSPKSTFTQIKSLIIKSAEIVDAYYEEFNRKLLSAYSAESEFGTYAEQVSHDISVNADNIEQTFEKISGIESRITGISDQLIKTSANIRSGLLFTVGEDASKEDVQKELGQPLDDGVSVYGLEIGQTVTIGDENVFEKFARFTSYGMALYDNNGDMVAFFADTGMSATNITATNSVKIGGFKESVEPDGGSVEKWVGV